MQSLLCQLPVGEHLGVLALFILAQNEVTKSGFISHKQLIFKHIKVLNKTLLLKS